MARSSQIGSTHVVIVIVLILVLLGALGFALRKNFIADSSTNVADSGKTVDTSNKDSPNSNDASDDENEKLAKTLLDVYIKAKPEQAQNKELSLTNVSSMNSQTQGYKVASGAIYTSKQQYSGLEIHFYQDPKGIWHYVKVLEGKIDCEDLSSGELRKAYLGETCYIYPEQTESTVK